jgi:hypothetical protein
LCFTPSIFWVNKKNENLNAFDSIECSSFTGLCCANGATVNSWIGRQSFLGADFHDFMRDCAAWFLGIARKRLVSGCENLARILAGQGFSNRHHIHRRRDKQLGSQIGESLNDWNLLCTTRI